MTTDEGLALAYLAVNILALLAFFVDKRAARKKHRRISERSLLVLSFFGPFGAVAGMKTFHHKTRKRTFLLVPLFLMLHLAIFIALVVHAI